MEMAHEYPIFQGYSLEHGIIIAIKHDKIIEHPTYGQILCDFCAPIPYLGHGCVTTMISKEGEDIPYVYCKNSTMHLPRLYENVVFGIRTSGFHSSICIPCLGICARSIMPHINPSMHQSSTTTK